MAWKWPDASRHQLARPNALSIRPPPRQLFSRSTLYRLDGSDVRVQSLLPAFRTISRAVWFALSIEPGTGASSTMVMPAFLAISATSL